MILPIVVFDALGIGLVFAFGKALWGRAGGIVAALLMIAHPLDFAWSTMITGDIILSFFSGLTMLAALRALTIDDSDRKRRLWTLAAVSLWLAFHTKVSALFLLPALAFLCWHRRAGLDRSARAFVLWAAALFAATAVVSYAVAGDPLAPYHVEIRAQGLAGHDAIVAHRMTAAAFWAWPHVLFLPDGLGDLLFSVYPHLLVVLGVAGWFAGLRPSPELLVWLLVVFAGMQLNVQRVEGVWVAGFRNVRHAHVFVYPIVLLLAGYLVGLRARLPGPTHVALAVLLSVSVWQGVSAASKTRLAFGDCRTALRYLMALPSKPVYSDFQLSDWAGILPMRNVFPSLLPPPGRGAQLAEVRSAYLVTGGAREPLYGCIDCIPLAADVPLDRWRLLLEIEGPVPPPPWRPEPLRVWAAKEGDDAR
jgi:4-amino-4-deoxy-L-arabinose transferase-like glycosyltransferase